MQLKDLINNIPFNGQPDNRIISAITYDSRKVRPGTLFVAIEGKHFDGHDFILQAIEKGASAILSNGRSPITDIVPIIRVDNPRSAMSIVSANFFGNPSKDMKIVGVTGTNGKTSTAYIIDKILKVAELPCGTIGTLGFSSPSGLMSTGFTTPESVEIHQLLSTLKSSNINCAIMEISSHALTLDRVKDVDVDIGVFTNLSNEHLDFHGDMESYFDSKFKLFKGLSKNKLAIINLDDPYGKVIADKINCNVLTFGLSRYSDIQAINCNYTADGTTFEIKYNNKKYSFFTPLIGSYNLYNILGSISVAISLKIDLNIISKTCRAIDSIPGRMEAIKLHNNNLVIIDYAHTPDAYNKLLSNVKNFHNNKKIITLFGCGGNRDQNNRSKMAEIAEKYSDKIFVTSDNPRKESFESILYDIEQGFCKNDYTVIKDRTTAIKEALNSISKNTILIVLGKGHEKYQEINGVKMPHDDLEIIKRFEIESRNKRA